MHLSTLQGHVKVNEVYDTPTIQGEGPDIGKPCLFLRLHHCHVGCPDCDSFFSWKKGEEGQKIETQRLADLIDSRMRRHPGCGLVVSGGEPLLQAHNASLRQLIEVYQERTWTGLETSGFLTDQPLTDRQILDLHSFLDCFNTVTVSPKITPCLHGDGWTDEQLEATLPHLFAWYASNRPRARMVLKFVARDEADLDAVRGFLDRWEEQFKNAEITVPVYVMPYGTQREEILQSCEWLIPHLAQTGWILSPRLHSILWGPQRGK